MREMLPVREMLPDKLGGKERGMVLGNGDELLLQRVQNNVFVFCENEAALEELFNKLHFQVHQEYASVADHGIG